MTTDPDTISAGHQNPEDQAREVVEAARAAGPLTSEIEVALIVGARRHARFVRERIGQTEPQE